MKHIIRFMVAYALYAAVILGHAYYLLVHPAGTLLSPSPVALAIVTATSLALPILDAVGLYLLRPRRVGRTMATLFTVGIFAEAAGRGELSVATLVDVTMRLLTYLIILTIAVVLYLMVYSHKLTFDNNDGAVKRYTF